MSERPRLRYPATAFLVTMACSTVAQRISGSIPPGAAADGWIHLAVAHGTDSRPVDSVKVGGSGTFAFRKRMFPIGFYTLAINDSDQVDLILDPSEEEVELSFSATPLRHHLVVDRSDENKRLWEYKLVSKEAQAIQAAVDREKQGLRPDATRRVVELDSIGARAIALKQAFLQGVVAAHPDSYFAKVIRTDRALDDAAGGNAQAVLSAFDFSDPALLRCSLYDKALLTFLRNLHATSEEMFLAASDSLLVYANGDADCRGYMLEHLIGTFSTYGPESALQHLIDRYVAGADDPALMNPALRSKVKELLKVAVGNTAPGVDLPTPSGPVPLRGIVERNRYTALFFFSSTCEHCHLEIPALKDIRTAFNPRGFDVVGIALDTDSAEFGRAIEDHRVTWNCYSEFNGWGSTVAKAFQVRATPYFFLLDREMRIVAKPRDAVALGLWLEEHMD